MSYHRSVPNGDWSDCLIIEESQEGKSSVSPFCGIGKRYRRLDCLDMSNQLAEPMWDRIPTKRQCCHLCDISITISFSLCGLGNDGNSNKSSFYQSEDCIVSCPTDCLMSPWTEWGLCDTICGHGLKNRTSKVYFLANLFKGYLPWCWQFFLICRSSAWPAWVADPVLDPPCSTTFVATPAITFTGQSLLGHNAPASLSKNLLLLASVEEDEKQGQLG